jgi:hypothetical protein
MKTNKKLPDARYTIGKSFVGHPSGKRKWVARFCGEWIGCGSMPGTAIMIARLHRAAFLREITGKA